MSQASPNCWTARAEVVGDALEHEAMPLEKVIEILTLTRYPGHNAAFSVNFIYQRSFIENADYGTFKLVDLPSWSAGAMYDLNFFMVERPEGWRLSCEYNTGLYLQASIERLLQHFVNVLSAVALEPTTPIAAIPILDAGEIHRLTVECNNTAAEYPARPDVPASLRAPSGGDAHSDCGCRGRAVPHISRRGAAV